ncbi:hypothetical protein ACFSL6_17610 [Paenibacillus thailandensis]|uniref:Uncharacterized protein n=1 Tax=Paenibacillus thailandensis TaxID=393250 RepID=A0ABW5R2D5_9BACL
MAKDIRKVPVCFNILDPDQARMHEWLTSRTNRSGYLKRLIQRDMEGGAAPSRPITQAPAVDLMEDFNPVGFI